MIKKSFLMLMVAMLLTSCVVGPNYKRAPVLVPEKFKEAPKGWKMAQPNDNFDRGEWWRMFNDPQLNALEMKVNITNQNVMQAASQYQQSLQLVNQARASYFPTLAVAPSVTRQRQVANSGSTNSLTVPTDGTTGFTTITRGSTVTTIENLVFNASWEPDIWGSVHRTVEANVAAAQASAAALALARLSAQTSLAQFYFELRGVDRDLELLNATMGEYKKALQLTKNRYSSGVASRMDVALAQNQLDVSQAQATALGVTRAQYEHAIAVLVGTPPALFTITPRHYALKAPQVPAALPCSLLERRPDVAQAERLMAQANAQIGVAIAAYYPVLSLTGNTTNTSQGFINWFSVPTTAWSIGAQLMQPLVDGGLRIATTAAARANYNATIASYRQVVLAAFQDTEDNLASVRILEKQERELQRAAASSRLALKLTVNQYKSGTVAYANVITAQNSAYSAEKNAIDVAYMRMVSSVGLIKSLGGGWHICTIRNAGCPG